jgi:polygalacturonase
MPKDRYHQMIVFSNCRKVLLSGFECIDAPYWTILIVHCDRVNVTGISVDNNLMIPNNDGLDIVSSSNVNVSGCTITSGDDAIVLAGYAHHFGDPGFKGILRPSRNINVSNCILQSRSSGIRIGGWDQNHMSNYNFSNITIFDSNCGINITVRDSGSVSNVNFSNIRIETRLHTATGGET